MAEEIENTEDQVAKARDFVRAEAKAMLAEMQAQERQTAEPTTLTKEDGNQQLREVLEPFFKPELQQARLESMSAMDASTFYRKNRDAEEYEDQIEAIFTQSMKAGRPWQRAEIHRYIIGKEVQADPDKYVEKVSARKNAQLSRAEGAIDFGFNTAGREREVAKFKNFDQKTIEEMEKDLDGVTF